MSFCGSQTVTFSGIKNAQVVNISHLLGVLVLQTSSKVLLCVSLEVEPGPCSKAASLTSLISSCLPFETQGRSWRLKPVSYKQEMRDR